jgi:hypothetical protein
VCLGLVEDEVVGDVVGAAGVVASRIAYARKDVMISGLQSENAEGVYDGVQPTVHLVETEAFQFAFQHGIHIPVASHRAIAAGTGLETGGDAGEYQFARHDFSCLWGLGLSRRGRAPIMRVRRRGRVRVARVRDR